MGASASGGEVPTLEELESFEGILERPLETTASVGSRFWREAGIYNLSQVIALLATFTWSIVLANGLGAAEYGRYATVAAFIAIFGTLLDFGFELVVVRDIARNQANAGNYITNSAIIRFACIFVFCGVVLVLASAIGFTRRTITLMLRFYASTAVNSLASLGGNFLQAVGVFRWVGLATAGRALLVLGLGAWMFQRGSSLAEILVMYIWTAVASVIVLWSVVLVHFGTPPLRIDFGLMRTLFLEATPVGLAALFSVLLARIDKVALGRFASLESVAWYNAAYLLIQGGMDATWTSFNRLMYPVMSRASNSIEDLSALTRVLLFNLAAFFVPIAAIVTLFADNITSLLFRRPDFTNVATALRVVVWLMPLTILWATLRNIQLVKGHQLTYALQTALGVIIDVLALVILLPWVGWIGAGFAAVITQSVLLAIAQVDVARILPHGWPGAALGRLMGVSLLTLAAGAMLRLLHLHVAITMLILCSIYGLLLARTLPLLEGDRAIARRLIGQASH